MKKSLKLILTFVFLVVVSLGWKFPLLGFVVLWVMMMGMFVSPKRGRWVCANACPRGSFLDTLIKGRGLKNKYPKYFRSSAFKWIIVSILMCLMFYNLVFTVNSFLAFGLLLWRMCFVTSIIAILMAFIFNHRAWCAICPMGTIQTSFHNKYCKLKQ